MFKKITLNNGLRIILVPWQSSQAVTVLVLVGTGSKYETKEVSGISHFLEHMFFKGTEKRPSSNAIAETLDKIGGIYNAFTSEDYTGYFAKVSASHFELALDWVSDIYLNSLLPEEELQKEKGVILEEINMYYDHPMSYLEILWPKLLYGNQPAGWPIAGEKETVSKISRQDLFSYMKSQYTAPNTIVCLAGKIESSEGERAVKKYFSKIRTSESAKKIKVFDGSIKDLDKAKKIERQTAPAVLLEERKTDQTHLCLGVRGYNIFHPQRYVQELLGLILGGMMSSRLFDEVRTKMGIAYYITTAVSSDPDVGYLVTQAGIENKNLEKGISAILKEYKKISEQKVPKEELKKAKECIKGKTTLLLESSDALASFYAAQELSEKKILTPKEIFAKIDKVTDSDILSLARDIFQPQKLNLALLGPFNEKSEFEKLLKI